MNWRKIRRDAGEYLGILVGALLLAVALDWFTVPNRIAPGGVSGLATVIYYVLGWPVGVTMLAVNVPLFLAGIGVLGVRFGIKSLVGAVSSSAFVELLAPWVSPPTHDPLLASVYGGLLIGVAVGITFRFGGSTGGTDIAARLLQRVTPLSLGRAFMIWDGLVIAMAAVAFNAELALYAFLSLYVSSKTIDFVQEGRPFARAAVIVSQHADEVGRVVTREIDRGATIFRGRGAFTGEERDAVMVVVARHQIHTLIAAVRRVDPKAFVVVTDVSDVLGEGFERPGRL